MSQELADYVRGKCKVVAVSDSYKLAPWADALVSNDRNWWEHNRAAMKFAGRKFSGANFGGVERLASEGIFTGGTNSGLQGMRVAHMLGATKILLLGFDMQGSHYFGLHPAPLKNTTAKRFQAHIKQFDKWRYCTVINCTPRSALKRFTMSTIEQQLPQVVVPEVDQLQLSA